MTPAAARQEYTISVDTFDDPTTGTEYDTVFYHGPERLPDIRLKSHQEKIAWHHTSTFAGGHKGISAYHFNRDYVVLDAFMPVGRTREARIERWWIVNLCPDETCCKVTAVGRSLRQAYANAWRAYREYLQGKAVSS